MNQFFLFKFKIPRNVRLMYIHAYQSLVWNEMASQRIAKFGLKLYEGDLVYTDQHNQSTEILDDPTDVEEENSEENDDETTSNDKSNNLSRFQTMVKPLTKGDLESNKYTIFDIVLPLPGHDIAYPSNECSQWYEERLSKDNLSSEKLKLKQKYVFYMLKCVNCKI